MTNSSSGMLENARANVLGLIHDVPDFPQPGILFKDLTPVLADPDGFAAANALLAAAVEDLEFDLVFGVESRGLILGAALAAKRGSGFVPIRKPNKLPRETHRVEYALEYGTDILEVHRDAAGPRHRVVIVDDVLATGGTAAASVQLVQHLSAELVAVACLVELTALDGRSRLGTNEVRSALQL